MKLGPCRERLAAAVAAVGVLVLVPAAVSAGQGPSAPAARAEEKVSTPRNADGKPDLAGVWRNAEGGERATSGRGSFVPGYLGRDERKTGTEADGDSFFIHNSRRCTPNQRGCRDNTNQSNDREFTYRDEPNRPLYKAEYWDKVQFLDYDTNFSDPLMRCVPLGVPRVGPPAAIYPVPNGFILLHTGGAGPMGHDYRLVPTDGRGHNPDHLPGYWGNPVGRWEGDTLVVESTGFNDTTWIASGFAGGGGGYFHSFEMRVIERFRREGNTIRYEVTVDDPEVLQEPWTMDARTLRLDTNPNALFRIAEGQPCENIDEAITTSRIRH